MVGKQMSDDEPGAVKLARQLLAALGAAAGITVREP